MFAPSPTDRSTISALRAVGEALGTGACFYAHGRFVFPLGDSERWRLTVSRESAGRFRLDACHCGRVVATMWALERDRDRLAALAESARDEVAALA